MYYRCYDWGWYYSPYRLYVYGDLRTPTSITVDGWQISKRGDILITQKGMMYYQLSLYGDGGGYEIDISFGILRITTRGGRATIALYDAAGAALLASYNL